MAVTRLQDVVIPEVFGPYMQVKTMEKADIFTSGLVVPDEELSAKLAGGGTTFQSPVWNDLSDVNGSEIGSDDPAKVITPDKLDAFKMQARRQVRAKAWSAARLTSMLAGDKPMERIGDRVADWWARDFNRLAVSTLNGVINANVANNGGDMVFVAGVGTGGSTTPSDDLDATILLDAKQTMGDMADELTILMVHSVVKTNLQKLNLIDFIPDSDGRVQIPYYLGYRLIASDRMPVASMGGGNYAFTSYLTAPGILAFGEHAPEVPVEVARYAEQGNGVGVDALFTRRQFAMQPIGHNWKEASVALEFPTNTELALGTNWERKFPERKQTPFVAVISRNG